MNKKEKERCHCSFGEVDEVFCQSVNRVYVSQFISSYRVDCEVITSCCYNIIDSYVTSTAVG